ncbi:MAG: HPr family phosphocarrier protein [Alphaproteobacteria bacterium]|nr:HPr family phosphocarrier protein [Alphaproteobacteria bacterium]
MDATQEPAIATVRRSVEVVNDRGLHARAAARFVKLAETFDAEITVIRSGIEVSGGSIMGLMMLAAGPGCAIEIVARGREAAAAVAALAKMVSDRFGEG